MAFTRITDLARCQQGRGTFVECAGRELAVFLLAGPERVIVIDNACPHASGNLSGGSVEGGVVTCPWHQWQFNIETGICVHSDKARVRCYAAEIRDGGVWAELDVETSRGVGKRMSRASVIKICGLTTASDARFVLDAGADWIGLNFVAGPRRITMEVAGRILHEVGERGCAVALLLIDEAKSHEAATDELSRLGVRRFQLYGQVTPDVIAGLLDRGFEVIAVRTIADGPSLQAADRFVKECGDDPPTYMLLDAASGTHLGGTGQVANWPAIVEADQAGLFVDWPPLILAGGLNADNVGEAMHLIAPRGVDVSSAVESRPGRKDPAKVSAFIEAVRRAV